MSTPRERPSVAVMAFCGLCLALNILALVYLLLSAAAGNWADLPSCFVFAVGSGLVLANADSLDCAT